MATVTTSLCLVLLIVCVAAVFSSESAEISPNDLASTTHHQAQKRSTLIEPVETDFDADDRQALFENPYDELAKRSSLFRFGKRGGSLFRFGKRGGSLFRFGKRGGTLFRFGRSGPQELSQNDEMKRNSLFRFGKRADDPEILEALEGYDALPSYVLRDVGSKRNINSFHWGEPEK